MCIRDRGWIDDGYDGTPGKFLANDNFIQVGFSTNEALVYTYGHEHFQIDGEIPPHRDLEWEYISELYPEFVVEQNVIATLNERIASCSLEKYLEVVNEVSLSDGEARRVATTIASAIEELDRDWVTSEELEYTAIVKMLPEVDSRLIAIPETCLLYTSPSPRD